MQDGVTLFIKETSPPGGGEMANEGEIMRKRKGPVHEDVGEERKDAAVKEDLLEEHKQCSRALFREQKKLRRSAEKRLMTHLGMKGEKKHHLRRASWQAQTLGRCFVRRLYKTPFEARSGQKLLDW